MDLKLREQFKVEFNTIDLKGNLSICGVAEYMQIIAAHHAQQLDFDFYKNGQNPGCFWIISKVRYEIESYPQWQQSIEIETYPGGYDKLYAVRLFKLYNESGKKVGHIIGNYLLMDQKSKRPMRIKGAEGRLQVLNFPYEGEKLQKLGIADSVLKQEKRKAYYSEMDLNGHMNNVNYVKWSVDLLPTELLDEKEIAALEINYNAAIKMGEEVVLTLSKQEEDIYIISGFKEETKKNYFVTWIWLREKGNRD